MVSRRSSLPVALTVAGSDSGGGAGIQADLRVFQRFGVAGASAVTLITAQGPDGIEAVHFLPAAWIGEQMDAVLGRVPCGAVKTGAIGSEEAVRCVAERLARRPDLPLVVDPVIQASDGTELLAEPGVEALRTQLLPWATLVTPNRHEAERLSGVSVRSPETAEAAARALHAAGAKAVLVKGGHLPGPEAVDVLFDGHEVIRLPAPRLPGRSPHGTGCVYSAAITARLALGDPLERAVRVAKAFVTRAIALVSGAGADAPPLGL